jgi:hypothetical protein
MHGAKQVCQMHALPGLRRSVLSIEGELAGNQAQVLRFPGIERACQRWCQSRGGELTLSRTPGLVITRSRG